MAFQSPMISVPKKSTDEVDWTTPIRHLIAQSYGENPDNYASECAQLQRCRQDAVRGAGSDLTARDLLYKYFGQLELLELRFPEIKVTFPWNDAFTNKLTTQTSIAFEKASILFQIAATHSSIAAAQSRADTEGTKRAFYYFRSCAGMLTYINDNFLHAPSTDLSRDVVKFLSSLILAQATEVFFEKCIDEKKGSALVAKVAAQGATMYNTLCEEVKEFMGKGIFDRNWVILIQIKAKYFTSLSQYHRSLADSAASKHGDSLVRLNVADTLAKEASRLASTFSPAPSPTLPADAGSSIQGLTKTHATLVAERRAEAIKENDLIYNAILPSQEALPKIDGLTVATPVPIQEVYGAHDVQKTIGPELFSKLLPLSVHESASVYSEEKAKLVRSEVEATEAADVSAQSALESLGVRSGLTRYRAMAEGRVGGGEEVPLEVRKAAEDVGRLEREGGVESMLGELGRKKESVGKELDVVGRNLEIESRECEEMRLKWEHRWAQDPSAGLNKTLRTELKSHTGALEAAETSDGQVLTLWKEAKADLSLLQSRDLENLFAERAGNGGGHLLDLDVGTEEEDTEERAKIGGFVAEIEERLSRLSKIARERTEILRELKDKVQTDDVSHLLLINRRNTGVEPTLFAAELEKFRPFQQRLAATVTNQDAVLADVRSLWSSLRTHASGAGARRWDERERRKRDLTRRFIEAKDAYMQVRDGLVKGLKFYGELGDLTDKLSKDTRVFLGGRRAEREKLINGLEREKEKEKEAARPPPLAAKPPGHSQGLEQGFQSMNLGGAGQASWQQQNYGSTPPPRPPQQYTSPPPPPQSPPSQYNYSTPPIPPPPTQPQYHASPVPPPPSQPLYQPLSQPQYQQQPSYQPPQSSSSFLPPPPPRPTQASFNPSPAGDPYASLAMFEPRAPPPPPPNNPQATPYAPQQQPYQQPYAPSSYQTPPPAQQAQQAQQPAYQYQSQGSYPPPPPNQQPRYAYAYPGQNYQHDGGYAGR